ncbi:MAG: hypothetical protein WC551_12515 [Patescibacteria group bacterium]
MEKRIEIIRTEGLWLIMRCAQCNKEFKSFRTEHSYHCPFCCQPCPAKPVNDEWEERSAKGPVGNGFDAALKSVRNGVSQIERKEHEEKMK